MLGLQRLISALEGGHIYPYISGFYFTIALVTWLGGRKPGFFTLVLSAFTSAFFLMAPRSTLLVKRPSDIVALLILILVSIFLILGVDALRSNVALLAETQENQEKILRLNQDLNRRAAEMRTLLDVIPIGIAVADDVTCRNIRPNPAMAGLLKIPVDANASKSAPPAEQPPFEIHRNGKEIPAHELPMQQAAATGQRQPEQEIDIVFEEGDTRRLISRAVPLLDEQGRPRGAVGAFLDITERRQSEVALRESEARKTAILESALDGIITMDHEGRIREWNPAAEQVFGYSHSQAIGQMVGDLIIPPALRDAHYAGLAQYLATGEGPVLGQRIEVNAMRADGSEFPAELAITPIQLDGNPLFTAYIRDITQRKQAEEEIQRLLTAEQARADREALLNRIGQTLRSTLNPDAIQARAVATLGLALAADRCFFVLFDAAKEFAQIGQDWYRDDLSSVAGEYRLSEAGVDFVRFFRSGTSQVVDDARTHAAFQTDVPALTQLGLRSGICVPLFDRGRLVAALVVAMAEVTRAWTTDEVTIAEAVAAQLRAAAETARVQQREHAIATTLQEALQPTPPEKAPGLDLDYFYRPALDEASIGGDFFDVFPLDKGSLALVVGDLSGKGLAAAAQVATVRNMLRYALYHNARPVDAVTELNRILAAHNLLRGFATLFVGVYDSGTHLLTYVSCGQEPGLLRRAATSEIEELPPTGPVLGMIEKANYSEQQAVLSPGDALALYTDGFTEAGRSRHDLLGVPGMITLMQGSGVLNSARSLMTHIVAGTEAHAAGALQDDACLLAAIVQPPISLE